MEWLGVFGHGLCGTLYRFLQSTIAYRVLKSLMRMAIHEIQVWYLFNVHCDAELVVKVLGLLHVCLKCGKIPKRLLKCFVHCSKYH